MRPRLHLLLLASVAAFVLAGVMILHAHNRQVPLLQRMIRRSQDGGGSCGQIMDGGAVPAPPRHPDAGGNTDPWEQLTQLRRATGWDRSNTTDLAAGLGLRLWCTDKPHAHACRARNLCLIRNSPAGFPDGWYLPYKQDEAPNIWTPAFTARTSDDPVDTPVEDPLFTQPDPRQDNGPFKQDKVYRMRLAGDCMPGVHNVVRLPGRTWLLDWEWASMMPMHASHFLRPVLGMFAARNVSQDGFIPALLDRIVVASRSGRPSLYQADMLRELGAVSDPYDPNRVLFREHVDAVFAREPGTALCFEHAYMAFEEYYFKDTTVCPVFRQQLVSRLAPDDGCPSSKVVYVARTASDSSSRAMANEPDVLKALGELTDFEMVSPNSQMSLAEQAALFSRAGVVVAMHGSHNANSIFLAPGASFVEVFPWKFYHDLMPTVMTRCGVTAFQVRSSTVHRDSLPAELQVQYDAVTQVCANLNDMDCFWSSMDTRKTLRSLPFHVDLESFKSTVTAAMDAVSLQQQRCIARAQQQVLHPFVPCRDTASAVASFASDVRNRLTVYLSTFDRDGLLRKIVAHYASSPFVDTIIVSWSNVDREPPSAASFGSPVPLFIVRETNTSMNNRFKPHHDMIRTAAVFSVDDDILVPLEDLHFGLSVWQQHPDQLVGFLARTHTTAPTFPYPCDTHVSAAKPVLYYSADCKSGGTGGDKTFWSNTHTAYSMVLDSACIFHAKYLDQYTYHMPQSVRDLVDDTRNCEDIALPMLLSHDAGLPGIYIKCPNLQHLQDENEAGHHPGLNKLTGHYEERTMCVTKMSELFGYPPGQSPLLYSNLKFAPVMFNEV